MFTADEIVALAKDARDFDEFRQRLIALGRLKARIKRADDEFYDHFADQNFIGQD